jgi:hypothetical protein
MLPKAIFSKWHNPKRPLANKTFRLVSRANTDQKDFICVAAQEIALDAHFEHSFEQKEGQFFGHFMLPEFTCGHIILPGCLKFPDLHRQYRLECGHYMLPAPAIL